MKLIGALTIAAFLVAGTATAKTVTIANGNDYAPFSDESLKKGGMASHLVEEAFKAAGWTVTYDWLPWKRGFEMAKKGDIDAAIPWTRRQDRVPHFLFSDPLVVLKEEVWALSDSKIKTYDDLKGKTGCIPIGYSVRDDQKALFESGGAKKDTPKDMTTCFKKLIAKRVDFIFVNNLQAASIANTALKDKNSVRAVIAGDSQTELHILVGKSHPNGSEIIAAFNKGLAALKANGNYEKIIASH